MPDGKKRLIIRLAMNSSVIKRHPADQLDEADAEHLDDRKVRAAGPSASATASGNEATMPKTDRINVRGKPPHCVVETNVSPRHTALHQDVHDGQSDQPQLIQSQRPPHVRYSG